MSGARGSHFTEDQREYIIIQKNSGLDTELIRHSIGVEMV